MARPLRLEFAGALYHITARGEGREDIYLEDSDRRLFLDVLVERIAEAMDEADGAETGVVGGIGAALGQRPERARSV